jgi:hypothetical protein
MLRVEKALFAVEPNHKKLDRIVGGKADDAHCLATEQGVAKVGQRTDPCGPQSQQHTFELTGSVDLVDTRPALTGSPTAVATIWIELVSFWAALASGVQADIPNESQVDLRDCHSRDFAVRDLEGNRWSFGTYRGEPRKR